MQSESIQTESLADQAYSIVEQMIVSLELPPGSVFSEGQLSEQIGIGRTPLREALQKLAHGRLVAALPRRGMMVTDINVAEHLAMLETRRVLDRLVAQRAAKRRSLEQASQLRVCAEQMSKTVLTDDIAAFMALDRKCDRILDSAARNPYALQCAAPLHAHCRRFWTAHRVNGDLKKSIALHSALMFAVADADQNGAGTASDALMDYLERFTKEALDLI